MNTPHIDFEAVNRAALSNARYLLEQMVPGGKFRSLEYVVKNPRRDDHRLGSFSINYKTGVWKDFASEDGGGDLVSLVAYLKGVSQGDAARELAEKLGVSISARANGAASTPAPVNSRPTSDLHVFHWGNDGPPLQKGELRRHAYKNPDGLIVRIKVKFSSGKFANCYRVFGDGRPIGWQKKKPGDFQPVPYVTAALNPFDLELKNDEILWPEGEKDVDNLSRANLPSFTFGGVGDGLPDGIEYYLKDRRVVILSDNDEPGRTHAEKKAAVAQAAGAASIKIVHFPELPPKGDVSDYIAKGGTADELMARIDSAAIWSPSNGSNECFIGSLSNNNETSKTPTASPVLVRVSDVASQPVRWLWPHRIAYGKLSIIAGEPGLGKSQLTMFLAAAVTKGGRWWPDCPDNSVAPANVILLSAEDDIADTIRPRLEAAGADLTRVTVLKSIQRDEGSGERGVNIGEDAKHIEEAIERTGNVSFIGIDPVSAYLGRMSGNNNVEVRFALAPIQAIAMKYGAAVVAVSHLNKPNAGGSSALHRVTGSGAFSAAARAVFLVVKQPDSNQNLFLPGKNNLGREQPGLVFAIEERDTPSRIPAPAIRWTGESVTMTADEALAAIAGGTEEHGALAEAKSFLLDLLTAGPLPRKELEKAAEGAGIADKTLRRAKTALGVIAERTGGLAGEGKWTWRLPSQSELDTPKTANNPYDGHTKTMGTLGDVGHLRQEGGIQ